MKSDDLKTQRAALVAEARAIVNKAETEKRDLNDDERSQWEAKMLDVDTLANEIAKHQRNEKLDYVEAELRQSAGRKASPISRVETREEDRKSAIRAWALHGTPAAENSSDMAVRAAHCGINIASPTLELRALSVGTTTAGGFTVPVTLSTEIEKALKYYCNVRQFVKVINTGSGENLDWPTVTDVSNSAASNVGEAGSIGSGTDATFGKVTFKALKFNSLCKVSIELLQDSVVDIESLIGEQLGERMGRAQETSFMTGAGGGSAPNGLVTGAAVGVNLASGNAITFAKLKSLEHSVDIAYRGRGAFLMHDSTWAAIEQIVDSTGRPIFLPGYQGLGQQTQRSIFGYPVYISNAFAEYTGNEGDNKPMILFGDFSRYMVRDVAAGYTLTRLNELYAGNGQVGFQLAMRTWGDYIGPSGCVKSLNSYDSP